MSSWERADTMAEDSPSLDALFGTVAEAVAGRVFERRKDEIAEAVTQRLQDDPYALWRYHDKPYTIAEVADIVGVAVETAANWTRLHPSERRYLRRLDYSQRIRILPADFADWMQRQR